MLPAMCDPWTKEAISTAVGAGATVFLALLTVPNLIMLWCYVKATNKMAKEQLQQGKASRRPFFAVEDVDPMPRGPIPVNLRNVGSGIAHDVAWRFTDPERNAGNKMGAVCPNISFPVILANGTKFPVSMFDAKHTILVTYADSAGTRYWSTIDRADNGQYVIDTGEGEE
jgi:hypothetical protein